MSIDDQIFAMGGMELSSESQAVVREVLKAAENIIDPDKPEFMSQREFVDKVTLLIIDEMLRLQRNAYELSAML